MSEIRQQRLENAPHLHLCDLPSNSGHTEKSNTDKNIEKLVSNQNCHKSTSPFAKSNSPSSLRKKAYKQLNYLDLQYWQPKTYSSAESSKSCSPLNEQNDEKLVPLTLNYDSSNTDPKNFPDIRLPSPPDIRLRSPSDFPIPVPTNEKMINPIRKFLEIIKKHKINMCRIEHLSRFQNIFDEALSIFHNNHEIFLFFLKFFLSPESFDVVKVNLSDKKELIKHLEAISPITYLEIYFRKRYKRKLEDFSNSTDYKKTLPLKEELDKEIEDNNLKIYELEKKCSVKFVELLTCRLLPFIVYSPLCVSYFPSIESLEKKAFIKSFKLFFKSFKNQSKLAKYFQLNKIRKDWLSRQQPVKIDLQLKEKAQKIIFDRINEEKKQFEKKLDKYFGIAYTSVLDHALNFNDFKQSLLDKGFVSNRLNNICSWEEFNQEAKKNGLDKVAFLKEICQDTVRYHMTVGKLLKNAVQQMVLEKIKTEQKFLIYNSIQCIINLIVDIVQLFLIVPKTALFLTGWGIKKPLDSATNILGKDFSIPGINLLLIANSDLDLSVFGAVNIVANQAFGYIYKPNEYSLKGCVISLQKRKQHIVYIASYLFLKMFLTTFELSDKIVKFTRSKFASAKLNPVLANNQESNLTPPISIAETNNTQSCLNSPTYKNFTKLLDNSRESYTNSINDLNAEMKKLKKLDIQKDLNPDYCSSISAKDTLIKYLKENDCPKLLLKKLTDSNLPDNNTNEAVDEFLKSKFLFKREHILNRKVILKYNYDKIDIVKEYLEKANKDLFLKDIKEFFCNDLNFSWESNISRQVDKLFTASFGTFFKLLERLGGITG